MKTYTRKQVTEMEQNREDLIFDVTYVRNNITYTRSFYKLEKAIEYIKTTKGVTFKNSIVYILQEVNNGNDTEIIGVVK